MPLKALPLFNASYISPFSTHYNNIIKAILSQALFHLHGRVLESSSLIIRASIPSASLGEMCYITKSNGQPALAAQVVGFREGDVFVMPFGDTNGLSTNSQIIPIQEPFSLKVGYSLLGRVLDGLGKPIDNGPSLNLLPDLKDWPLHRNAPDPYTRKPINSPLALGIRVIDSLITVGKGQRMGLFSGSGVGKSSLMAQIVRNTAAKVVVVCLVGERGREVMEFINGSLKDGLKKCVMVVATSDKPSLVRYTSCYTATAIAEWFRDQGEDVLFLMDSATRFARAQREIGLALGEPPARQGYPPSVFFEIPRLLERTGTNDKGSITAIYTVLVQGGDFDEPISDEVRGILDGHIILNRSLAENGHWPAVDVLPSLSRVMNSIIDDKHREAAQKIRGLLASFEKNRDLILLGAYKHGSDKQLDIAIKKMPAITSFLQQPNHEKTEYNEARNQLLALNK